MSFFSARASAGCLIIATVEGGISARARGYRLVCVIVAGRGEVYRSAFNEIERERCV